MEYHVKKLLTLAVAVDTELKKYHKKFDKLYKESDLLSDSKFSYGDFLDVFPLLGEEMFNKAINGKFRDNDHMEAEI